MAVRYKKQYTNQSEYLYDQAKSTGRFDEDTYNILLGSGEGDNYAQAVANTKYMSSDTFDEQEYALLSGEDKYAYLMNEYYVDKSSEQYNQNKAYLDEEIQKAIDAKTYDSLNGFEKFMSTLGGIVGNALNELVLGTVEGLIDVSLLAAGAVTGKGDTAKELIAQDTTGVAANRKSLAQFARAYTFIDKNGFFKGVNDVVTGITKMAPLAINIVAPGVGTGVYFAGMAGNTAEEAVIANPDIDYGSLLAYTAAVTGVEFATEKISSLFFGGSAIDSLMFKSTGSKAGSWISRIGIDFLSEGMEESVAEFADSVLYTALVDKNAPLASFGEVLYAGLIGGIIGGIGAGGRVLGTKRVAITEDGRLVQYDKNDKSFEGKVLGKAQSLTLQERIQNAKSSLDKSAVTDLRAKYKSKDLETIKKEHADEYQKAVEKDTKFQNEVTEAAVALSKILDLIGDTSFAKATELANYTIEQTQNLLYNYLNKTTATDVANRVVENKFAIKNPGSSLKINDALTTTQQRLKDAVKQKYDKNVYFGEIGTADGIEKKHGLTLDEKTIVIDSRITETMSLDNLIENVVKEELSHALQYDSGVITAQTIKDLNEQFVGIGGVTAEIKNRYEYNRKKNLTKISENQAKFLAESLLFDELTVAKVFITNNSTFNSVYKWLMSRKDAIERKKNKKTNKDKVEYRVLLKTMDTYRKTVAEKIGNEEDAATAAAEMNLTDEQLQKLLDTFLPDYSNEHYTLLGKNYTIHTQRRMTAEKTLSENRKTINLLFPLSYKMIYNPEYYKDEFVKDILSRNPDKDFRYNLQEYMINTFGFTINMADECLMEVVDYNKVITSEFDRDMSDLVANPKALDKYDSADKIFKDTFKNKFGDSLSNVKIKFVKTTQNQNTKAKYVRMDPITKLPTITVYMKENSTLTPAQTSALRHAVFHEMTHALSDIQGLQNGTSTNYVKSALLEIDDINVINKLSTILLTKKYRTENANNQRAIIDALAYGIYRITDGEYAAESYPQSSTREGDLKVALKAGATMNRSGFRTDGRVLYGYGRFKGIDLEAKTITQSKLKYDIEGLKSATEVVSYSLENKLLKHLQELGVQDYEEAGFDDRFITDILDNPEATVNDVWNKVNSNSVGDKKATNIIIKWLAPNNKTMKTIDDVEKVTKGNGLAYGYLFRKNVLKKTPDYNANKPHSFQEIENRIVDLMSKSDKNITLVTNTIERVADKLDRPENSTINKLLITSDFDYSLNAINKLYATISGEHGISSELKTEGIEITNNEGSDVDIAASESPYGVELSPEEIKIREEERAEDKRTVKDRIDSAVNEVKKSLETWLTTDQQNAWKGADKNEVKALKKILSEVEKSELSRDPDIATALTDIKSGKIFKDVVQNTMSDDNAFSIKNKINRNSSELKNLFGEDFLKTSGLKDILPQNKSNYVKMINKQRTRLKDAKLTEKQQKDLIERDLSEINSPNEFENIVTRLKEIKTPESIDKQSKITTDKTGFPKFDNYSEEDLRQQGMKKDYIKMSPSEYIDKAFRLLYEKESPKESYETWLKKQKKPRYDMKEFGDVSNTEYFKNKIRKGELFAMPYLDYVTLGQEGLHRAFAAEDLGVEEIEVAVMTKLDETASSVKETITESQQKTESILNDVVNIESDEKIDYTEAKQQEKTVNELSFTKNEVDKKNKLLDLLPTEDISEYQGEQNDPKVIRAQRKTIAANEDFFNDITSNELQAMLKLLRIDLEDPRAYAGLNLLSRYAYDNRHSQFSDISEFIKLYHQRRASESASFLGGVSATYGSRTVKNFIEAVQIQEKTEVVLPRDVLNSALKTFTGEQLSVEEFITSLQEDLEDLKEKLKKTKDAFLKHELRLEIKQKANLLETLSDGDIAGAIDAITELLLDKDTNQTENLEKINTIYTSIIDVIVNGESLKNKFNDGKSILSDDAKKKITKWLAGINSFRYMAMLSSPITAAKNAISNTMSSVQAIIEDAFSKKLENRKWLSEGSQGRFTGDYDQAFSDYVNEKYLPKILKETETDRYASSELNRLEQLYAEKQNPLKKNKITNAILELEKKMLSDQMWTTRRTLRNLKNMLSGSAPLIYNQSYSWLASKYHGKEFTARNISYEQLYNNIKKTNSDLAELFKKATSGDNLSILKLGEQLNIELLDDKNNGNSVFNVALKRSNKLLLKIDNTLTRIINYHKKHGTVWSKTIINVIELFQPFIRVGVNSTMYILDRSPVGLASGIIRSLQTKSAYRSDMVEIINEYYQSSFIKEQRRTNKNYKFNKEDYENWFDENVSFEVKNILNNSRKMYKELKSLYDSMVDDGKILPNLVGADNPWMRATAFEKISQGSIGTAVMTLGVILSAALGAFDYDDDDDYLGPVIKIGDLKIGLNDLSPFSTMFTIGAMLGSDNIDDKIGAALGVFVDSSILSTIDSAITYSDNLLDFFGNQMINSVQQYIPAITKNIGKSLWNAKKDKSGNWGMRFLKTIGSNSLIFNWLVPNKINPYTGETLKYYEGGWFEQLIGLFSPVALRYEPKTELQREAEKLNIKTTGINGRYVINGKNYATTNKDKEKYAKFRATYINKEFDKIKKGNQRVTVKDSKSGKFITTTYNRLTDEQKANVLENIYSKASETTKIYYWISTGNSYICTDRSIYNEYVKILGSSKGLLYRQKWSKSKFVEG